jgi:3-keto-5-aminohexanoate cleavage enzyme
MASLDMGPLNRYDRLTSENTRELVASLHAEMRERGIKPELEVFNDGHLNESLAVLEEFAEPPYLNFLFGGGTTSPPHPRTLVNRVEGLPERVEFTVIGLGRHQLPMTTQSLLLGGHVRVGLEDNRYYERGELATNEDLVARAARIAAELGRPVATPAETRELLGLRGR